MLSKAINERTPRENYGRLSQTASKMYWLHASILRLPSHQLHKARCLRRSARSSEQSHTPPKITTRTLSLHTHTLENLNGAVYLSHYLKSVPFFQHYCKHSPIVTCSLPANSPRLDIHPALTHPDLRIHGLDSPLRMLTKGLGLAIQAGVCQGTLPGDWSQFYQAPPLPSPDHTHKGGG